MIRVLSICLLSLCASSVFANEPLHRGHYLTAQVSFWDAHRSREVVTQQPGIQVGYGIPLNHEKHWALEFNGYHTTAQRNEDDFHDYQYGVSMDFVRLMARSDLGVRLFWTGGLALHIEDRRGREEFGPSFNTGFGLLFRIPKSDIAVRSDLRLRIRQNDYEGARNHQVEPSFNIGLHIPLPWGGRPDSQKPIYAEKTDCGVAMVELGETRQDCN